LYSPRLRCYFEITGTDWRKVDSGKRYAKPILAILKAKVDAAERYNLVDDLWFVSVNDMQGEIRFLPCAWVAQHSLLNYARDESAYYGVPWDSWLTPFRASAYLLRRLV
jgi:hypothetical protein